MTPAETRVVLILGVLIVLVALCLAGLVIGAAIAATRLRRQREADSGSQRADRDDVDRVLTDYYTTRDGDHERR